MTTPRECACPRSAVGTSLIDRSLCQAYHAREIAYDLRSEGITALLQYGGTGNCHCVADIWRRGSTDVTACVVQLAAILLFMKRKEAKAQKLRWDLTLGSIQLQNDVLFVGRSKVEYKQRTVSCQSAENRHPHRTKRAGLGISAMGAAAEDASHHKDTELSWNAAAADGNGMFDASASKTDVEGHRVHPDEERGKDGVQKRLTLTFQDVTVRVTAPGEALGETLLSRVDPRRLSGRVHRANHPKRVWKRPCLRAWRVKRLTRW